MVAAKFRWSMSSGSRGERASSTQVYCRLSWSGFESARALGWASVLLALPRNALESGRAVGSRKAMQAQQATDHPIKSRML
jgi:hypothetical protein